MFSKRILKSLPLLMVIPVVVAICLVGLGMYYFVLRAVSDFAEEQIKEALAEITSEVYDICGENFTALMQTGKMDDPKAVVIKKALTIGVIEEYVQRNKIGCRLFEVQKGEMLQEQFESDLIKFIAKHHSKGLSSTFSLRGKNI